MILITIIAIFSVAFNGLHQQYTVSIYGWKVHSFIKFLFSALIMLPFLTFELSFSKEAILTLSAIIVLSIATTFIFNYMLQIRNIYELIILLKFVLPFSLLTDFAIGVIKPNFILLVSVFIFFLGTFILFEMHKFKLQKGKFKKEDIIFITILLLINFFLPYLKQTGLNNHYFNNETMTFSWFLSIAVFTLIFIKPKIKFTFPLIRDYGFQSVLNISTNLALNVLIAYSVFLGHVVETAATLVITFLTPFLLKKQISKTKYIGVIVTMIGFLMIGFVLYIR